MRPTITPEATTLLERKLLTWYLTESESWLTNAQDSRVSSSSTRLVEVLAPVSLHSSWKDCLLIMERRANWSLQSTRPLRFVGESVSCMFIPSHPPCMLLGHAAASHFCKTLCSGSTWVLIHFT